MGFCICWPDAKIAWISAELMFHDNLMNANLGGRGKY